MSTSYYQPSNHLPLSGALRFLVGGMAAAVILGFGYGFITWYVPFTSIFMFLVFGAMLGEALAKLAQWGRLRSPAAVTRLALAVGLLAMYAQWSVHLTFRAGAKSPYSRGIWRDNSRFDPTVWAELVTSPGRMAQAMSGITGLSLDDNSPMAEWWYLLLFWGAESLVIVGVAVGLADSQARKPFSEADGVWATPEVMRRPVTHVRDATAMKAALEAGDYQALVPIPTRATVQQMMGRAPASFARLTLYRAPHDTTCYYLKLENFTGERRKGTASFKISSVVKYLHLPPAVYQELYHRFNEFPPGNAAWPTPAPKAA